MKEEEENESIPIFIKKIRVVGQMHNWMPMLLGVI
jgi:hypothetical protein